MSGQFSSVVMFCSLVAIAFAANRATENESPAASRRPASINTIKKEEKLGPFNVVSALKHTEKLRGPLSVKLEMLGPKPSAIGDVFVLRGTLVSREVLDSASYTWSVPAGVELVNGAVSGTLTSVGGDTPGVVELTFRKMSADNVQIHLMAIAVRGGSRFGDSAQYNTEVQDMLKPSLEKSSASSENKQLKIFH